MSESIDNKLEIISKNINKIYNIVKKNEPDKFKLPIYCVKCEKKINVFMKDCDNAEECVYGKLQANYGSIYDGSTIQIGLCDDCISKLIKNKKIKVTDYLFDC